MARTPKSHSSKQKPRGVPLTFAYALRSFIGYLEGTEKSLHTVKNYRSDLMSFERFLEHGLGSVAVPISKIRLDDISTYNDYLKAAGFKTNTRRRKILTVRRLLKYLSIRKKISVDMGAKIATPHKVERVPATIPLVALMEAIQRLECSSLISRRNQVLLWTLAETGCLVSEVGRLRYDDWLGGPKPTLAIGGKNPRTVPVSVDLHGAAMSLKEANGNAGTWLFLGFNKFGSMGAPISPRGVEMLLKSLAVKMGFERLTPRLIRHSVVRHWTEQGVESGEIRRRLGLKTDYAFRVYESFLKPKSGGPDTPSVR